MFIIFRSFWKDPGRSFAFMLKIVNIDHSDLIVGKFLTKFESWRFKLENLKNFPTSELFQLYFPRNFEHEQLSFNSWIHGNSGPDTDQSALVWYFQIFVSPDPVVSLISPFLSHWPKCRSVDTWFNGQFNF